MNRPTSESFDHSITLNGLRIHYRQWGEDDEPPLILLHGASQNTGSWEAFAPAMSDKFRVIAVDLRGHGESSWEDDYSSDRMAEDLHQLVEHLVLPRFSMVGHSLGGVVAWTYASIFPNRVNRIVLVDVGPGTSRSETASGVLERIRSSHNVVFDDLSQALELARTRSPTWDPAVRQSVFTRNLEQTSEGSWKTRYDAEGIVSQFFEMTPPDNEQWDCLKKLVCPILVIRGGESTALAREAATQMVKDLTNCRLHEIPATGHLIPYEMPSEFLEAVRPFLLEAST